MATNSEDQETSSSVSKVPSEIKLSYDVECVLGRAMSAGPGRVAIQSGHYRGMISRKHATIRYNSKLSQWVLKDIKVCGCACGCVWVCVWVCVGDVHVCLISTSLLKCADLAFLPPPYRV